MEEYTGWKKWCPTPEEFSKFEADGELPFDLLENEYLIICEDKELQKPIDQYCYEDGKLRRVSWGSIKIPKFRPIKLVSATDDELLAGRNDAKSLRKAAKRKKSFGEKNDIITPRNIEQAIAIDLLRNRNVPVKILTGKYGTGKSMLATDTALELIHKGEFERIIWIRNNVKVANSFDIGFLKGTQDEKMQVWGLNIQDIVGKEAFRTLIATDTLEIEPLMTLRGRDFKHSLIICDESQNLSLSHQKLILGRCAEGSEVWFLGDNKKQIDLDVFKKSDGLTKMIDAFKGNKLFGYVHFTKSERSAVASLADVLDQKYPE